MIHSHHVSNPFPTQCLSHFSSKYTLVLEYKSVGLYRWSAEKRHLCWQPTTAWTAIRTSTPSTRSSWGTNSCTWCSRRPTGTSTPTSGTGRGYGSRKRGGCSSRWRRPSGLVTTKGLCSEISSWESSCSSIPRGKRSGVGGNGSSDGLETGNAWVVSFVCFQVNAFVVCSFSRLRLLDQSQTFWRFKT